MLDRRSAKSEPLVITVRMPLKSKVRSMGPLKYEPLGLSRDP